MSEIAPGVRPAELVPGRPDDLERLGARLAGFAASAADAVSRLAAVESGVWAGQAGDAFREAGGEVPARFGRAATAFAAAARALRTYGQVLRESQAEAARAVRLVEQSTPESAAADRQTAAGMVARARSRADEAGRAAAAQLARAAADAPAPEELAAMPPEACPVTLQVVTEHQLTDPEGFVAPLGGWGDGVADMCYTSPHEVVFAGAVAGADTGEPGWQVWSAAGPGRQLGVVEPGALAALGIAAVASAGSGRQRRQRRQRTALGLVGLDEAELRRRRDEFGGARHRDGVLSAGRTARLRSPDAWRTRLASAPRTEGTVPHWTGSDAARLSRSRATGERLGAVDRDVRGAVLRTGRPAHEGV
jgi:hypothetical protein